LREKRITQVKRREEQARIQEGGEDLARAKKD